MVPRVADRRYRIRFVIQPKKLNFVPRMVKFDLIWKIKLCRSRRGFGHSLRTSYQILYSVPIWAQKVNWAKVTIYIRLFSVAVEIPHQGFDSFPLSVKKKHKFWTCNGQSWFGLKNRTRHPRYPRNPFGSRQWRRSRSMLRGWNPKSRDNW